MFTRDRLQGIAQKLDIMHGGAFDVGLTWLAPPDVILDLAEETVIIGRYSGTLTALSSSSLLLTVQSQHRTFPVGERGCGQLHATHAQANGASTVRDRCCGAGLDLPAMEARVQVSAGE